MHNHTSEKWNRPVFIIYILLYLIISLSMILKQPLGTPPDEVNRYKIPLYIYEHHALPNGFDEEIRIPGYGFSYGFQPILPYMVQGGVMILTSVFTDSSKALVYAARFTNCFFGLLMALYVWKLGRLWIKKETARYFFCFLVMFIPQSIFLHTYVNTESCAMLSTVMILYGITRCLKDDFSYGSCTLLSAGVILCALSYYNAYGYILGAIILFLSWCFKKSDSGIISFDSKGFFRKGGFICLLVLFGISWWFIRSAIIYDGDFLGLKSRTLCGEMFRDQSLLTLFVPPYKEQGLTIIDMLFKSDFFTVLYTSFICAFGATDILTGIWVYRFFKLVLFGGMILFLFCPRKWAGMHDECFKIDNRPVVTVIYRLIMVMCALLPLILCITYSYGTDYQPQGRYIMPALVPLCYFTVRGLEKGVGLIINIVLKAAQMKQTSSVISNRQMSALANSTATQILPVTEKAALSSPLSRLYAVVFVLLTVIVAVCLLISVYGYAFPKWAEILPLIF